MIDSKRSPDDSTEQRDAELSVLRRLSLMESVKLEHLPVPLPGQETPAKVEVDGFAEGPPPILVEVFTHYGVVKGGQRHKLLADAMKLVTVKKVVEKFHNARLVIAVTDDPAKEYLSGGWAGIAIRAHGIEVVRVELDEEEVERVKGAQRRQKMTNAGEPT